MISKENPKHPREKTAPTPPAAERTGEAVKVGTVTVTASAAAAAAGVAQGARASTANNGARSAYVPTRRRSRRNLLL